MWDVIKSSGGYSSLEPYRTGLWKLGDEFVVRQLRELIRYLSSFPPLSLFLFSEGFLMRSLGLMHDFSPQWFAGDMNLSCKSLFSALQPHHGVGCLPTLLKELRTCHLQTRRFGTLMILSRRPLRNSRCRQSSLTSPFLPKSRP